MRTNQAVKAEFTDKYGETRHIHWTRQGLRVRRNKVTPALAFNQTISRLIGKSIREHRLKNKMTLESLCIKSGLASSTPKSRMWEIENSIRKEGLRMGTLYAIAIALGVEASELMPPNTVIMTEGKTKQFPTTILAMVR